jgi:hypothetical protein
MGAALAAIFGAGALSTGCTVSAPESKAAARPSIMERAQAAYEAKLETDTSCAGSEEYALWRHDFLREGGEADQRFGAGTGPTLRRYLRDSIGSDTQRQFQAALDDMEEYAAIPPFLYLTDLAVSRKVVAALERAYSSVTRSGVRRKGDDLTADIRRELLRDPTLEDDVRLWARRFADGTGTNRQRAFFKSAHPRMAQFFTSC